MMDRHRIAGDYRKAGAFSTLVNLQSAIDSHTFLTRGGDLVRLFRMGGIDPECLDPNEIDALTRQFENTLRQLGPDIRVYQYLVKHFFGPIPHLRYPDQPVLDSAIQSRIEHLGAQPERLQRFDLHVALVHSGPRISRSFWRSLARFAIHPQQAWWDAFSRKDASAELAREIERAREVLAAQSAGFIAQLKDTLHVEPLDTQEGFQFLRRLLNFAPHQTASVRLKHPDFVGHQLCGSTLECFPDRLQLDAHTVRVLILKEPPRRLSRIS